MCLNPITIINPTRYLTFRHAQKYTYQVPCGRCADCLKSKSTEWEFRLRHEFDSTIAAGGYVLFDTLTYRPGTLPHLRDFYSVLPSDYNLVCFNRHHIRLFFVKLRRYLAYRGYSDSFKYFLSSEYGDDDRYTHRPHYHILFFVPKSIPIAEFSKAISDSWSFGRTDGMKYKGFRYVLDNRVFTSQTPKLANIIRYVCKYLQKDSSFSSRMRQRLDYIVSSTFVNTDSYEAKHFIRQLNNNANQFHLQSHFLGVSYLENLDLDSLRDDLQIDLPTSDLRIVKKFTLPMYYQRKLFFDLIEIDGKRAWVLNDFGKSFKARQLETLIAYTSKKYSDIRSNLGLLGADSKVVEMFDSLDIDSLSRYVITKRGRLAGDLDFATIADYHNEPLIYNYVTSKDKDYFGEKFVSHNWLGNDIIGYSCFPNQKRGVSVGQFIKSNVYYDSYYENVLATIDDLTAELNKQRQHMFDYKQSINEKFKVLFRH